MECKPRAKSKHSILSKNRKLSAELNSRHASIPDSVLDDAPSGPFSRRLLLPLGRAAPSPRPLPLRLSASSLSDRLSIPLGAGRPAFFFRRCVRPLAAAWPPPPGTGAAGEGSSSLSDRLWASAPGARDDNVVAAAPGAPPGRIRDEA